MSVRIDEVVLDTNEEWLMRNALSCYRERCAQVAQSERDEAEATALANPAYAEQCEQLAKSWDETVKRIDALEEKLG